MDNENMKRGLNMKARARAYELLKGRKIGNKYDEPSEHVRSDDPTG